MTKKHMKRCSTSLIMVKRKSEPYLTPTMILSQNRKTSVGKKNLNTVLSGGMQSDAAIVDNSRVVLQNVKNTTTT